MANVRGSCLCGGVKFEIIGPLKRVLNCHCSKCRKQHGAAFRSRARVRIEDFKWLQGEELVRFYQSSPGFYRGFCGACGSPIINKSSHPEFGVPLGILDDDPNVRRRSTALSRARRRGSTSPILFLNFRSYQTPIKNRSR